MKKSHRVAHENQRRGGFCYYHYTTFIATVKIPFSKKNTGSHYFLQYIINSVLRNSFFHHILTSFTTYLSQLDFICRKSVVNSDWISKKCLIFKGFQHCFRHLPWQMKSTFIIVLILLILLRIAPIFQKPVLLS